MEWYLAPLLLLAGILTDVTWALYIQALADRRRLPAAFYSVGTGIVSIVFVEGAIHVPWLISFWLAGLFIGTYYVQNIEKFMRGFWHGISKTRTV